MDEKIMDGKFVSSSTGTGPATYDITVELDGREFTFALPIEDAMRLISSVQTEVLNHWGGSASDGRIAVIHAENVKLGTSPKGHVLRMDTPEIGPFILDFGPEGLANLVRVYNGQMN